MAKAKQNDGFVEDDQDVGEQTFEGGDSSLVIDMDSVEEASFEVIPRGTYSCTIETCEFRYSNSAGKPMWAMTLVINDGEYQGRKLFNNMSFSEKALPFTKKTLAQIAPELLSNSFNIEESAADMEGKLVRAKVKIQKYEGENRSSVDRLEPVGQDDSFMAG